MKTEMLVFVVVAAVFFAVLLFPKPWLTRNPDALNARRRTLSVFVLVLALVLVAATVVRLVLPDSAPGGLLMAVLALQLIGALLYRQQLSRHNGAGH
jgi:quinol-cytochrome oxidoreductase complex cytochrome b subunit